MHFSSRRPGGLAAPAALGLAALAPTMAHAQSLNGQPVQVTERQPNTGSVVLDAGTQTVTSAGVSFTTAVGFTTVTPSQIVFTFNPNFNGFGPASFNGFRIAETGSSPVAITSVTLDPSSNISGFDASRISFDATDVYANFQGLTNVFIVGSKVTLDLNPAPTAVPEPSPALTFAVAALGLGGLMIAARKKRTA